MDLFVTGLVIAVVGGMAAIATSRAVGISNLIGAGTAIVGSLVALVPVSRSLADPKSQTSWSVPWQVPYRSFSVALDTLSAWFALLILALSIVAAVYGYQYLARNKDHGNIGAAWFFYNVLVAAMALVVTAHNGILSLSRGS